MRFTDLFVKRPVLAIVVSLVILIAGLQSIRALSVTAVSAERHRHRPRLDRLRRRERGSRARLHHDSARAGHRGGRRHRLHGVVERPESQHDYRAPPAQLRHERGTYADSGEGGAGPQRSSARSRGAENRARNGGSAICRDLSRILVRRTSIPTRLPTISCASCSRS